MLALKPPGITGGKVSSITALCNTNIQVRQAYSSVSNFAYEHMLTSCVCVQSETVLIQRVYTHFKKAPATHKLGVLYVVDSVTRAWVEQARKAGQTFGPSALDGTFAAGVNRVTELLPSFMTDIITTAPEDQKVRFLESSLEALEPLAGNLDATISAVSLLYPHKNQRLLFPCIHV
jgi:protein NRD1